VPSTAYPGSCGPFVPVGWYVDAVAGLPWVRLVPGIVGGTTLNERWSMPTLPWPSKAYT
jgi:hypothetical protein